MNLTSEASTAQSEILHKRLPQRETVVRIGLLLIVFCTFLVSLELMGNAVTQLGSGFANQLFQITANPFVSLFIGLLATAVLKSSSATISTLTVLVSTQVISLQNAVPMVIGANIGTTVTCIFVSMGHIVSRKEFRKAFTIALSHNQFNLSTAIILFPLEYYFQAISQPATWLAAGLKQLPGQSFFANLHLSEYTIKPLAGLFSGVVLSLPWVIMIASAVLLIVSLLSFTQLLKGALISRAETSFEKNFFKNPYKTLFWGAGITALIQSSTVSTSVSTVLVAADKISPRRIYPFVLGANLGTTITGILASFSRPEIALALAMAHVLFNFIGIMLFFPYGQLRGWPLWLGREVAQLCAKHRAAALIYVLLVFYILPFLIIFLVEKSYF